MMVGRYDVHVSVITRGHAEAVDKFHALLHECDADWPYAVARGCQFRRRRCFYCHGRVYTNPRLTPQDIKAAAHQCGIKVKIMQFSDGEKCFDPAHGKPEKYEQVEFTYGK